MYDRLLETLACPSCRGPLKVEPAEETELGVKEGTCRCEACGADYPIEEYVIFLSKAEDRKGFTGAEWKLENFEKTYAEMGAEQDAYEWRAKLGCSRSITDCDYPRVKGRLLDWLQPKEGDLLLDVGCGSGYFLREIARHYSGVNFGAVGMDVVPLRVRFLAELKKREGWRDLLCVVGDGERLPFLDGSFDVISCTEVLEHIPEPGNAIKEIGRALRPGGRFCASTPSRIAFTLWGIPRKILRPIMGGRQKEGAGSYDEPMHPWTLRRHLADAGLQIEEFRTTVIIPPQDLFRNRPEWMADTATRVGAFLENRLYPLFKYLGLHSVVRCSKPHARQAEER